MKGLYVVATPIGCLDDFSPHAREALLSSEAVVCENPEKTKKLLFKFGITSKKLFPFPDDCRAQKIFEKLQEFNICSLLVSAGSPGISDPGWALVKLAFDGGIKLKVIPGPSAVTAILSVCPFPVSEFAFAGFVPKTEGKIRKKIFPFLNLYIPVVIFVSKREIARLAGILPEDVEFFVGREMTKIFEEFLYFENTSAFKIWAEKPQKGEITVVMRKKK